MRIQLCTITGADEEVNQDDLFQLSREFPFVEWGILFNDDPGFPRYPGYQWVTDLIESRHTWVDLYGTNRHFPMFSAHLCGNVTDQFITDPTNVYINGWPCHDPLLMIGDPRYDEDEQDRYREDKWLDFQRIQVNVDIMKSQKVFDRNTQGEGTAEITVEDWPKWVANRLIDSCTDLMAFSQIPRQFCFQDHPGNVALIETLMERGNPAFNAILFDASKGTGKPIEHFPQPYHGFFCGYAGGIGPDNIDGVISKIEDMGPGICTIDMESGVRTNDKFDLSKVEKVLNAVKYHRTY